MKIAGWGRYPSPLEAEAFPLYDESLLSRFIGAPGGCIARGAGRSTGDAAVAGRVVLTNPFSCLLDFEGETGVLTCEAGASLGEIVETFLPRGWCPFVLPDSRHVTVGGAIAADIHGKNHHVAGCFSEHLEALTLMAADGRVHVCSREDSAELFHATCGGLGLTGIILTARFRLMRVESSRMQEKIVQTSSLGELLSAFLEYGDWPYLYAWIDCAAWHDRALRAIFSAGRHAADGQFETPARAAVIPDTPFSLVNRVSLRLFNKVYAGARCRQSPGETRGLDRFFFAGDRFAGWNRLYGPRGFIRYQLALPADMAESGLARTFALLRGRGIPACRAVLGRLGPANGNPLSFPLEGYCLSLDFAMEAGVFPLLEELDRLVSEHGGRLALATDAAMPPGLLRQGYPDLDRFQKLREGQAGRVFQSQLAQRLGI